MRVGVVDDEAPARRKLRELLAREPEVELAGEAASGTEAVELVRRERPDLLLLDIQMPELDGFGVIAAIGAEAMPLVVFVTAYDEHALRAFEVHAFDYLLKPFAARRLHEVLARARQRLAEASRAELATRLDGLLAEVQAGPRPLRHLLATQADGREVLLPVAAIDVLRAERNDVLLVHRGGVGRRRGPLRDLLARLDPDEFVQINRSEAVRLGAVREVQAWFHGDRRVVLADGSTLTWSRRYRGRAKGRL